MNEMQQRTQTGWAQGHLREATAYREDATALARRRNLSRARRKREERLEAGRRFLGERA